MDAVVSMLPNGQIVLSAFTGEVIGKAPKDAILIDCSTIDVATARETAEQAGKAGYAMVDAPVSGGIAAAAGGTLTFMVGGSKEAFRRAEPILQAMAKRSFMRAIRATGRRRNLQQHAARHSHDRHCGSVQDGSEARPRPADVLRYQFGVLRAELVDDSYCPVPGVGPQSPADNDYQGGFATELMLKDLRLAMDAAENADAPVPLAARAASLFEDFAGAGNGRRDFSAIITTY